MPKGVEVAQIVGNTRFMVCWNNPFCRQVAGSCFFSLCRIKDTVAVIAARVG